MTGADGSREEAAEAGAWHEAIDAHHHTQAHPDDPNIGVVRADPPGTAALVLAVAIGLLTIAVLVALAVRLAGVS